MDAGRLSRPAPVAEADTITTPHALQGLAASKDPKALRIAAREFESLFFHQLFKSMRQTIPKDELVGAGMGGEMFTDLLDMEYARSAAQSGSMGLAAMIEAQLGAGEGPSPGGQRPVAGPGQLEGARARGLRAYAHVSEQSSMTLPVQGARISSEFGMRQLQGEAAPRQHAGLDLAAPAGTQITAALGGRVTHAGFIRGYGNTVIVDHGGGKTTLYGHASELLVEVGAVVDRGTPIARVGSTGHSTGPHLHFEVRQDGRPTDPRSALGLHETY